MSTSESRGIGTSTPPSLLHRARLQGLIIGCNDDARVYRDAGAAVSDPDERQMLLVLSRRRMAFADELGHFVRLLGGRTQDAGSAGGALRRWARRLRTLVIGEAHHGDTLRECAHAEGKLFHRYERALRSSWPEEIRTTLAFQSNGVGKERDHMRTLWGAL